MESSTSDEVDARARQYVQRTRAAVERLLKDSSFINLSVEDIIQEAGIARSTFYVYFRDKGQMLNTFAEDLLDEARVEVRAWWELPPSADYGVLRGALYGFVRFFWEHSSLLNAVIDASVYDPAAASGFASMVRTGEIGIAEHIRRGQRARSVTEDIDPDVVARWLVRLVERGLYQLAAGADSAELERLVDGISMIVWNTLYRPARCL
jgi:TetR/AcrR family transcriptional regulator, ethionamide resistance regulator